MASAKAEGALPPMGSPVRKLLVSLAGCLALGACSKEKASDETAKAVAAVPAAATANGTGNASANAIANATASATANANATSPTTTATPARAAGDPLVGAVEFGPAGPVVIEPAVKLQKDAGGIHAYVHGWASDASELAYCQEAGGTGAHECGFLKPGGTLEKVSDFDNARGALVESKTDAIKKRLLAKGYTSSAATWLFAPELTLTFRTAENAGDDPTTGAGILRAGAVIKGEKPILPVYVESKGVLGIHPEAIAISPDGKFLGVVTHGAGGEGNDRFDLKILSVASLAGQVYNDTALSHHKKGDYQRAAELFHKATAADPDNTLAPYNYACALAKLKHPGTEAALKAAIAVGGAKVKAKAAKDSDFADVKDAAWFAPLLK